MFDGGIFVVGVFVCIGGDLVGVGNWFEGDDFIRLGFWGNVKGVC